MTQPQLIGRLERVSHRYGETTALDDVSLKVPAGRMIGLIGPDGVGKSTLLALLSGARQIQSGRVEVLGGDMGRSRHRRSVLPRIAYMPQGLGKNLYMDLTVAENLEFFGRLFGQDATERRTRVADLTESTGLAPFVDRPAGKLSGGMKQKLGLCCALIHDPDLLVLDEPTTGVDPLSRRQFWSLIDRIRGNQPGMSVLVATAYMDEAEGFDWLVAMNDGRILATGAPEELKTQGDADRLEEAFINLLPRETRGDHKALSVPPRLETGDGSAIVAKGLVRKFGDFTAVDNVSFEIERGEIFGFLGSNGCGKTTTMKMLTGLLPPTEGEAWLFGRKVAGGAMETRRRVGYMAQSFSLYSELTVTQNLRLHAQLFHLPKAEVEPRIAELIEQFGLEDYASALPEKLPLGLRQRLSLAVAIVHRPEMLILDEPTSGVDPVARDQFWELLIDLSRNQGVTIFISTHFMNEGERCDRISLMHAGKVLASDSPAALVAARGAESLEDAFVAYLQDAIGRSPEADAPGAEIPRPLARKAAVETARSAPTRIFSMRRLGAYSLREGTELIRDPFRLSVALIGTMLLMMVFGFGITLDVENLDYAALDNDRSYESRKYLEQLSGSRYFNERPPLHDHAELERRMRSGEISLALEIPSEFGRDLLKGTSPEVSATVDAAMPFRGETIATYVQGMHVAYLSELYARYYGEPPTLLLADLEPRFRYNQAFKSVYAMVPSVIALLLLFIPSILTALSVVREKELGSVTNLYVTPVTRLEFLLGKQIPYVVIGMVNFALMVLLAIVVFEVPVKGDLVMLTLSALIYVFATTAFGLFFSTFTKTQVAALAGTALATILPAIHFAGLLQPVSTLTGVGSVVGNSYPVAYFLSISVGVFTKGLGFAELQSSFLGLLPAAPILLLLSVVLLRRQER